MEGMQWGFKGIGPTVKIENGFLSWSGMGESGSYPMSAVQGIQYESNLLVAYFRVIVSGGDNKKIPVPKWDKNKRTIEEINEYITAYKQTESTSKQPVPGGSIVDELQKLKGLLEAELITPAEFEQLKASMLAR